MRILGIDYGHKRVGLAYGDELGVAVPVAAATEPTEDARFKHIGEEIKRRGIQKLVVGYPYNMDGTSGSKIVEVDGFIKTLKEKFGLPVDTADERLSSFQAEQDLAAVSKKHKKSIAARKKHRLSGDIDSRAIALVLQEYLDERPTL